MGVVYSALDADGNRVGQPLKSSLFGEKCGVEGLERLMVKTGEELKTKGIPAGFRTVVATSLAEAQTSSEFPTSQDASSACGEGRRSVGEIFRARLRERGIGTVLRYGNEGRLFGATFIDHNTRTVLNG